MKRGVAISQANLKVKCCLVKNNFATKWGRSRIITLRIMILCWPIYLLEVSEKN